MKLWRTGLMICSKNTLFGVGGLAAALTLTIACGPPQTGGTANTTRTGGPITGSLVIDGSSTVGPISEAMGEEFRAQNREVRISVAMSGTGGGFKKFANGEIDITGASRPIEAREIEAARANNIEFVEIPVAYDGLTVVVNPQNDWADTLTVDELRRIWEPGSQINNWSQVRPGFPNVPIRLYGAGVDSGTFDYFTAAIVGKEKASRSDVMQSEDDNQLVIGVAGDRGALGYFGYSYFDQNRQRLKAVRIDAGQGGVEPTPETISQGTYRPLARPLFYYVSRASLDRPEVQAYLQFVLSEGRELLPRIGFVPLSERLYELSQERLSQRQTGSIFDGRGPQTGVSLEELLARPAGDQTGS
jgi:phosphate transport system substrate-binding protein